MFDISNFNLMYSNVVILSRRKKNAESLGREVRKSGDAILKALSKENVDMDALIFIAKKLFGARKIYLLIDDTLISKQYSSEIAGTSDNYDSADGSTYRSLCSVVVMLTDGRYAIPLDHAIWTSEEFMTKGEYKTKTELAQELIDKVLARIDAPFIVMDGLYATVELIDWMIAKRIYFEMRFHSNRAIIPDADNCKYPIKEYFSKIMKDNQSYRTITASWKKNALFFTAVRRITKTGRELLIYQVSNYQTTPRNHARIYGLRWNIEKFFRTSKQHLGLGESQSRKINVQINHIRHVFLAYAILQVIRKDKGFKNIEKAIDHVQKRNNVLLQYSNTLTSQNLGEIHA